MPSLRNLITAWQALSRVAKHVVLILCLAFTVIAFGLGCGWFAKHEAKVWLCQYDRETDPECVSLVKSPDWGLMGPLGMGKSSDAAPSPSPSVNTNSSTSNSRAPNVGDSSESPTPTATPTSGANVNPAPTPVVSPTPPPPTPLTKEQENRLAAQALKVKGLIRHHGRVMAFFFQAYYTSICVLLFAGAFVAISMFFIATRGWGPANEYVKTLFVVMTTAAAFYGLWPPVFQQEKNISDNKALFLEYQTLQNEIDSYPVTRSTVKNEHKEPNDFINYIDSELARIGNVAIGFDYTKITYKGAFESNSTNTPSPLPAATQKKKP